MILESNPILNISFPFHNKGQLYMEETNKSFIYYAGLPGLVKNDLDIKLFIEEDYLTILVNIKKSTTFVSESSIRIVKLLEDVKNTKEDIVVIMEKGILTIEIPKLRPTLEYIL